MIPDQFANYFVASAGAGAALMGLLFVAISLRPEHTVGGSAHPLRKGVASGAFTALTNAFFVSMSALIPHSDVGMITMIVGVVDVIITVRLGRRLLGEWRRSERRASRWAGARIGGTLGISAVIYGYEAFIGFQLLLHPGHIGFTIALTELLLGVYAIGLGRSWELLGGPGGGISHWLNPLQGLDETTAATTPAPLENAATPPSTVATPASAPVATQQPASKTHSGM